MKIGQLKQVELREVWPKEETDFSDWMSKNLDALSDVLDMNLECIETEKRVTNSNREIDLFCVDDDENEVIIENQLTMTDPGHLGRLLIYSVAMNTPTVVWITRDANQEHIDVINWLNKQTDKNFYLVKVEAYRIGTSEPAPFFSVLCKPSLDAKEMGIIKKELNENRNSRRNRKALADTIVVPANKEGFDAEFISKNCWWPIRMRESMKSQIKYIAGYQTDPVSAITHLAEIKEFVECEERPGRLKAIFKGPAKELKKPIPRGKKLNMQSPFYCESHNLDTAKNIDELVEDKVSSRKKAA